VQLPADTLAALGDGRKTGSGTTHLSPCLVENVTKKAKDAELRRRITQAAAVLGSSNGMRLAFLLCSFMLVMIANTAVQRLETLRDRRTELARTIGFESFADMVTCDRMAQSPQFAVDFLLKLSQCVLPRAIAELRDLAVEKKMQAELTSEANSSKQRIVASMSDALGPSMISGAAKHIPISVSPAAGDDLDIVRASRVWAWDYNYYSEIIREREYGDPNTDRYFTMEAVLKGLALVTQRVFGVHLVEEPLDPAERWDLRPGNRLLSSTVRRFRLTHQSEGDLGIIYFDPFPRAGKYGGAAHFVVFCGKQSHPYDLTLQQAILPNSSTQRRQLPIVALLTNFHLRSHPDAPHLESMCITDVETLFHEFGHALHSLLSRTEFQHVSGK
jgi:Zn-dependent oligopeptidase